MDDRRAREDQGRQHRPSDEQLLAALRRAVRHRQPAPGPAPIWALLEHLAIRRRSADARRVRAQLEALERRGLLARGREHGIPVWSPTPAGERALRRAGPQRLPESPRHLAWRHARAAAAQELPRFRVRLAATIAEAERMLAREAPSSQAWLELGRRLAGDCRRLGSAWHCLHEWPEPDDEAPEGAATDQDGVAMAARCEAGAAERARLAALRNIRLWREPD